MNLTATLAAADAAFPDTSIDGPVPAAPRHDLYVGIHKALRHFMLDTLMRLGTLEVRDDDEITAVLGQLESLLATCGAHIAHENDFVHAALEARVPGASARIAGEHEDHHEAIAGLREDARQLVAAPLAHRPSIALRLYRHVALFVAENLQHMHHEETVHNALLWSNYTDAELESLHQRLVASLPPQEVFLVMRWMVPALAPRERVELLAPMRDHAPEGVFDAVIAHVDPHLDDTAWTRLAAGLGLDPTRRAAAVRAGAR